MKPDYGKYLLESGLRKDIRHCFYDVPFSHLSRINIGMLSTMVNIGHEGQEFAVSFDCMTDILLSFFIALPSPLREEVSDWMANPNSMHTLYDFHSPITVSKIVATLGDIQTGQHGEVFVPLVVNEIEMRKGKNNPNGK